MRPAGEERRAALPRRGLGRLAPRRTSRPRPRRAAPRPPRHPSRGGSRRGSGIQTDAGRSPRLRPRGLSAAHGPRDGYVIKRRRATPAQPLQQKEPRRTARLFRLPHPPDLCATAKNGAPAPPNAVLFECKAEFESGRRGSRKDPKNLKTQKTVQHER
jgi:hypothetical protein